MLILGTANRKKGIELADLVRPVGVDLRTLADFPGDFTVEEDGETFAANARLKAAGYARLLGQWVLADDSGLEVDLLDNRPGVFSARYSGADATDESNNRLLLQELGDTPLERRTARFVCHIAVADPSGRSKRKATPRAVAESSSSRAAKAASATTRCSRLSSIIGRLPNSV
jgi:XTP/dITP diphosphohydrolase